MKITLDFQPYVNVSASGKVYNMSAVVADAVSLGAQLSIYLKTASDKSSSSETWVPATLRKGKRCSFA